MKASSGSHSSAAVSAFSTGDGMGSSRGMPMPILWRAVGPESVHGRITTAKEVVNLRGERPSGAKAPLVVRGLTYGLKSVPFKTRRQPPVLAAARGRL